MICGNDGEVCIGACIDRIIVHNLDATLKMTSDKCCIIGADGRTHTEYYKEHSAPSQAVGIAFKRFLTNDYD